MVDVRATSLFTGSIELVSRKWSAPLMSIGLYNQPASRPICPRCIIQLNETFAFRYVQTWRRTAFSNMVANTSSKLAVSVVGRSPITSKSSA